MGIKNLKKIIQQHAPNAISNKPDLYNKKIAIDSSILLYKFRYTYTQENFHIQGFLYKVIELLEKGVVPVFVFDGPPPQAKRDTLDKRVETRTKMQERVKELNNLKNEIGQTNGIDPEEYIDSDDETENPFVKEIKKINNQIRNISKNILVVKKVHSDEVMEFLKSLGIPFLKAISESEETCAVLQKRGLVDYVLTEDTDALTFGAKQVILGNELYNLDRVLERLEIDYTSFIDLCILCGCDYTGTIPKVGPVNALRLIKRYHSIDNFEITFKFFKNK
jgi:flap endonuclease-1